MWNAVMWVWEHWALTALFVFGAMGALWRPAPPTVRVVEKDPRPRWMRLFDS